MVKSSSIPLNVVRCVEGINATSLTVQGDSGSPIFQDDKVVAVCKGWGLYEQKLAGERVRLLTNTFISIAPYTSWIDSIISPSTAVGKETV